MKKLFKIVALVATLMASGAFAADKSAVKVSYKVNGVPTAAQAAGGGPTTMTVGAVNADKVAVNIGNIAAVWKTAPPNAFGASALPSEDSKGKKDFVLSYPTNPEAFSGARQCILKRGADWPGTADLKSLRLDDPKVACSPITGADSSYAIDVAGDYNVLGIVPVIEFKDGSRAWGSHPFGQSRGKNMRGQTITLLEVVRDASGNAVKVAAASNTAKTFFRGRFQ